MQYKTCVSVDERVTCWLATSDGLFPGTTIGIFPTFAQQTRVFGHEVRGVTGGGTHTSDGETTAGCGAIARSPLGVCHVMCGPVNTDEAHVAFAGAS